MWKWLRRGLVLILLTPLLPVSAWARADCAETWAEAGPAQSFRLPQGLLRSQGVTTDGHGWFFSWQGGVEKTDDAYVEQAINGWPTDNFAHARVNPDGTNYTGGTHIGDIDYYDGRIYAPVEDGNQGLSDDLPSLNDPEYQRPYIALYDAKTLAYTGVRYELPLALHAAGVPWVAVDARHKKVKAYTAEWEMPKNRINVFDLNFRHRGFIKLVYPASLGPGFKLDRIQGAKVLGDSLYATRDDDAKNVFKIDLETGVVTKLFSLDPGVPSELEGIAIRRDGTDVTMHVLLVVHNDVDETGDSKDIAVEFHHYKRTKECED